jgi:hypothetical protein
MAQVADHRFGLEAHAAPGEQVRKDMRRVRHLGWVACLGVVASLLIPSSAFAHGTTVVDVSVGCSLVNHTMTASPSITWDADDYPAGSYVYFRFRFWQVNGANQRVGPVYSDPNPNQPFPRWLFISSGGFLVRPHFITHETLGTADGFLSVPSALGSVNLPVAGQRYWQLVADIWIWNAQARRFFETTTSPGAGYSVAEYPGTNFQECLN